MRWFLNRTFRALHHRNYRLWFVGQSVSLIGTWMQSVAQQVLVYRLTGSATALGMVNFMALIPLVPFSFWGGAVADRWPKRRVVLMAQVVMMIQAFALAGLTWSGQVRIGHVYALAFILGAANAVDMPARQAMTVELVEGKEDLTNAIGLNSAMFNLARAVGPALAGGVVATAGEAVAFFINALTFLAVIASLLAMRNLSHHHVDPTDGQDGTYLWQGLRFALGQEIPRLLIALVALSALLSMPYSTLMPVFAQDILLNDARPVVAALCEGPLEAFSCRAPEALPLGLLLTAVGVGAVLAALTVSSFPSRTRHGAWLTLGSLGFPATLIAFSFSRSFLLSLGLMFLVGWFFVLQNALANTLLQLHTPDAFRGRVMAVYSMTVQGMMRIGGLQAGLMADWLGAPLAIGGGAFVSLIFSGLVAFRRPTLRSLG
ncbi:MFS transporter [uncultured Thermanaerothrix sp.]|uniref:MFS transporter n=1 Tax=uncultured Thermanaerothrix sp. TaxID=1195149 RepID=UPI002602AD01|nr:MFS transporter [uncultured Thermanaerothrix sp.]